METIHTMLGGQPGVGGPLRVTGPWFIMITLPSLGVWWLSGQPSLKSASSGELEF